MEITVDSKKTLDMFATVCAAAMTRGGTPMDVLSMNKTALSLIEAAKVKKAVKQPSKEKTS